MDPVYISPARTLRSGIPEVYFRNYGIPEFWNSVGITGNNDITYGEDVDTWKDYLRRLLARKLAPYTYRYFQKLRKQNNI